MIEQLFSLNTMGNRCSKSEKNVESVCEQVNGITQNAVKFWKFWTSNKYKNINKVHLIKKNPLGI